MSSREHGKELLTGPNRETGRVISEAERDEGWRRSEVYRHWLLDKVFATEDQRVVRIMVLPVEDGNPKYRDADPTYVLAGLRCWGMLMRLQGVFLAERICGLEYGTDCSCARDHRSKYVYTESSFKCVSYCY